MHLKAQEMGIYLDNNSTTALDFRVLDAVQNALSTTFGNPSSIHSFGQKARACIIDARSSIASFFGVHPEEIIFTSGGTEAVNLFLRGFFQAKFSGHIITTKVEHAAVYETIQALEQLGCSVSYIDVGSFGAVKKEQVEALIRPDTRLIALMAVNNETGVKTDIQAIGDLAHKRNISFFVDAISAIGKEQITIHPGISGMAFSGHKIHGPKGTGFLIVRKGIKLLPCLTGGLQEMGLRAGTEDVPGIVGLSCAVDLVKKEFQVFQPEMKRLLHFFEKTLMEELDGVFINGDAERTVNCCNVAFDGIEGEVLLKKLDLSNVAASHGSACSSGALEPSRILLQMGYKRQRAASSIRFSLSRFTTQDEIERALQIIIDSVQKLRSIL